MKKSARFSPDAMNGQRVDKWLWFARIKRTRTEAARLVRDGCVRINAVRITQPGRTVCAGDVLTIALNQKIRILRVQNMALRRGSAEEARPLFEELRQQDCVSPCVD